MDVCLLRGAGVETGAYLGITGNEKFILGKVPPPTHLPCPYFLSDKPVEVRIIVF